MECFPPKVSVPTRVNQLRVHPDAITSAACRAFQNMCYTQCQPDFTQIARATLELLQRGAANDFKVRDLCQIRENVIVNTGREVFVTFVVTVIFLRDSGGAVLGALTGCDRGVVL